MSCKRAQHATAQRLKHIWISDEALTHAFNRYLRLSLVHRRHGSNVPGPLEARRRLAKRRIGMESVAHNNMPPPFPDLGSLFGVRSAKPPPDFEKGRRWEPPTQFQLDRRKGDMQKQRKAITWHEEESVLSFFSPPPDPVVESKRSFEALLNAIQGKDQLTKYDLHDVLGFLNSPHNQPAARLTLRLVQWLDSRDAVAPEAWSAIAESTKLRARDSEINVDEVSSILTYLIQGQGSGCEWTSAFIQLPEDYHKVYYELAAETLSRHSGTREAACRISLWLNHLIPAEYADHRSHQYTQLYQLLAEHFDPSDFSVHFGQMPRTTLCRILLKHWAPRYSFSKSQQKERLWSMLYASFTKHNKPYANYALNDLIAHLARWKIPYGKLLKEIFSVYLATQSIGTTKNLALNLVYRSPSPFVPRELGITLVERLLKEERLADAVRIFMAIPGIPLSAFPELPVQSARDGQIDTPIILAMLHRTSGEDYVRSRDRHHYANALGPTHVEIVHQTAAAWAKATHINARTALRRVWECYRFLKSRRAPLSPIMSQALSEAGIVRAMKENGRLSGKQAHYVINVVESIEGREEAGKLDQAVSQYWEDMAPNRRPSDVTAQRQRPAYTERNRYIWSRKFVSQWMPPKTYYRHMMLWDLRADRLTSRSVSPIAQTLGDATSEPTESGQYVPYSS